MESTFSICFFALTMLAAAAIPMQLAAQQRSKSNKHHHYQFIDLGTFGGSMSRNDGVYPALNNSGTVIGGADTTELDPFYPNFNPLILPMVEASAAAAQTSPAVRDAARPTLPQSLVRRMNRYHFPGRAFGPRN
jgi:hypothetical protein